MVKACYHLLNIHLHQSFSHGHVFAKTFCLVQKAPCIHIEYILLTPILWWQIATVNPCINILLKHNITCQKPSLHKIILSKVGIQVITLASSGSSHIFTGLSLASFFMVPKIFHSFLIDRPLLSLKNVFHKVILGSCS